MHRGVGMESHGIRPPAGLPTRSSMLREPIPVREAAGTELGPSKAVTAVSEQGAGKRDQHRQHHAPVSDLVKAGDTESLLRVAEHPATSAEASPNQALMRQRAYHNIIQTRSQIGSKSGFSGDRHADIHI